MREMNNILNVADAATKTHRTKIKQKQKNEK